MIRFSVVISVFNKEKYISKMLRSVLDQTYSDFEVIILNDGSTDDSEAKILTFKDKRIRYFSENNKGAAAGRNFVIKKAATNYIALLDADDFWEPNYLMEQKRLIEKYPFEKIFAVNSQFLKNGKIITKRYSVNITENEDYIFNFFESSLNDSITNSSTTVLNKTVFEEIGYYDENIISGQDTDIFIRLGLKYNVVFSPKILCNIVVAPESLSRRTKKVSEKADFEKFSKYESNDIFIKKYLDLNRYSLCLIAILEGNKESFKKIQKNIDQKNLTRRQRLLLLQNKSSLEILLKTKNYLSRLGFRLSAFK